MDGPQLKAHTAQLVTLKFSILQNPGQTASCSQAQQQGCQQKYNYMTLPYTI
jgi:hypothetical protein